MPAFPEWVAFAKVQLGTRGWTLRKINRALRPAGDNRAIGRGLVRITRSGGVDCGIPVESNLQSGPAIMHSSRLLLDRKDNRPYWADDWGIPAGNAVLHGCHISHAGIGVQDVTTVC
jgi:hypothetical protein